MLANLNRPLQLRENLPASGIALGFISYAVAKLATGRARECPVLTYIFAALFVVQFIVAQG